VQYRQQRLDNGLTVLAECNDAAHFAAMGVFVRAGSRDEAPDVGGVSHFLEHMVFKGTDRRSADQVNLELDEMGGSSNARTGEESTIYHASVLPEFQGHAVELLADLMRPALRDSDFETEKKVIIEEIMMYQDQPPYGGHELLMTNYFGNHPLGHSVLGTSQTVGDLSATKMRDYFIQQYSPANMALVAAGKVDFERLVADVENYCGGWQPHAASRVVTPAAPSFGFSSLVKENSSQQYILQVAPGPSASDDDRYAMRLLSTILGDDSGSRLYWDLLDSGLAESAGIGSCEFLGAGLVMSYLCCDPELAQENMERLHRIQASALQGISSRELELAKQKIVSHILLASERTEPRMFNLGGQWLSGQDYKAPAEIVEIYRQITLEEVQAVAEKYPLTRNCTLSVGARGDLQQVA
jgi:predicted Zn-dependent peptidase